MKTADDFLTMDNRRLMAELCAGAPIDPAALDDTEYRGVSLGLPAFIEKLSWKTFQKTFHRDVETGDLRGWNVRLVQNGLHAPCVPKEKKGEPFTFGHYRVVSTDRRTLPVRCEQGLLIDYGQGGNGRLDFIGRVRDPIVAVNEGSAELLLGWSYLELGFAQLKTPVFFTLERVGPLRHKASPPSLPLRS